MFANFFKKRRIKQYARKLPAELTALYGQQPYYSKGQVDRALTRQRLNRNDSGISDNGYAYAMYCSPQEFQRIHDETGESGNYDAMRAEIAQTCFSSTDSFSFTDVDTYATESSCDSGNSSDSGSCDSGGGDGGGGGD
jgi:hypothetical protein